MKWILALIVCIFSMTTFAATHSFGQQEFDKEIPVLGLLAQPIVKQQFCAKAGYIGYQNALASRYLNDPYYQSFVRAYAWGLVAFSQLKNTHDKNLISSQANTLKLIEDNMNQQQVTTAEKLAQHYIQTYSKSWPAASSQLAMKNYPRPCSVVVISANDPI